MTRAATRAVDRPRSSSILRRYAARIARRSSKPTRPPAPDTTGSTSTCCSANSSSAALHGVIDPEHRDIGSQEILGDDQTSRRILGEYGAHQVGRKHAVQLTLRIHDGKRALVGVVEDSGPRRGSESRASTVCKPRITVD